MDLPLYLLVLGLVKFLQALPLRWVARLGRAGGGLAYYLDRRHRRVAHTNISKIFAASMNDREARQLTRENFRRLGENYCTAIKTSAMSFAQLQPHLSISGLEKITDPALPRTSRVFAVGHFGNFELYSRPSAVLPQFHFAATYRALNQPRLNRLLSRLRSTSGILLFERRTGMQKLQEAIHQQQLCIGFLADQKAGRTGVLGPFLGHECSTTTAPALFSLRYRLPLFTGVCYRTRLAHWHIEIGDEIPTFVNGQRRPVQDITLDINKALEKAVLRDPANWFWVHDRWKFSQFITRPGTKKRPSKKRRPRRRQNPRQASPKN